jgi:hypothetical protein
MTALAVGLTLLASGFGLPTPTEAAPPRVQPAARAQTEARPEEAPPSLTGSASRYAYVKGGAAAGPQLRRWLGKDWRGTTVTVCAVESKACTKVKLTDSCQCYRDEKRERIIDLDDRSFAKLAALWRGVIKVTVTR